MSDLEIGYSARNAGEWDRLMEALEVFELVETAADHRGELDRFSGCWRISASEAARSHTS